MSDRNDALEEAAKLAAGHPTQGGTYRSWPWHCFVSRCDGSPVVKFADALAAQIRALKREPSPPSGPSPAEGAQFFLPLTLKPIDPSIPFDDGDRVIVDAEGAQVGMISNPKLAAAAIAAINASPQPARACALGEECRCLTEHIWDCPNWLAKQPQPSPAAPDVAGLVDKLRNLAALHNPAALLALWAADALTAQAALVQKLSDACVTTIRERDAAEASLSAKEAECERLREALRDVRARTYSSDRRCVLCAEAVAAISDLARAALAGKEPQQP